jgi:hypothetical protein
MPLEDHGLFLHGRHWIVPLRLSGLHGGQTCIDESSSLVLFTDSQRVSESLEGSDLRSVVYALLMVSADHMLDSLFRVWRLEDPMVIAKENMLVDSEQELGVD